METPEAGKHVHDPVSAISESEATGETAAIFTDIRRCMKIPLLTSIWRTLAGIEDGLSAVWRAAKPLVESGRPAAAVQQLRDPNKLPVPEPLVEGQLACAGVEESQLFLIRSLIDAYNRSNGINLITLTALVIDPSGNAAAKQSPQHPEPADSPPADPLPWPELPPLPEKNDLSPQTWAFLERINRFGSVPDQPGLATIWRHLAHWPGFLAVVHAALAPLERNGTIRRSIEQLLEVTGQEAQRIVGLRPTTLSIPEPARGIIASYVLNPGLVVRMVSIGHGLANWLQAEEL
jgi:hypothetical protein